MPPLSVSLALPAAGIAVFAAVFAAVFNSAFGVGFGVGFAAAFVDGGGAFLTGMAVLGTGLLIDLGTVLPDGLTMVILGDDVATADFLMAVLPAGVGVDFLKGVTTLADELAFVFTFVLVSVLPRDVRWVAACNRVPGLGTGFVSALFIGAAFLAAGAAFLTPADFTFATGLTSLFGSTLGLTADLLAGLATALAIGLALGLDFFVCTFTTVSSCKVRF